MAGSSTGIYSGSQKPRVLVMSLLKKVVRVTHGSQRSQ
jgi:hypothetical protein